MSDVSMVKAKMSFLRVSPRKLSLVAGLIRKSSVNAALDQLAFCRKRIALDVRKCLWSAIANADNNYYMDVDSLYVKEVLVGKAAVMKRMRPGARGRAKPIKKYISNLTIVLAEKGENYGSKS